MEKKFSYNVESEEDLESLDIGLKNTGIIDCDKEYFGHRYCKAIGEVKDGVYKSYFIKDQENGDMKNFNTLRNSIKLVEHTGMFINRETGEEYTKTLFYIPYKIVGHSVYKPTVTDTYVSGAINAAYDVEYEVLFITGDGCTRYLTFNYKTQGAYSSSVWDQIEMIETSIEYLFEEDKLGFKYYKDDDYKEVTFYDELGQPVNISIDRVRELLDMITSIRVTKCDQRIMEEEEYLND